MANPVVDLTVTKTLIAWAERAAKQGLDLSTDLQPGINDPQEMRRVVRSIQQRGLVYDAAPILGLGKASDEPMPNPRPGEIVIRVGPWSLQDLSACKTVVQDKLIWDEWYNAYLFSHEKLTPGIYGVRLPIQGSNEKSLVEQKSLLLPGEKVTPIALVATVFFCHLKQEGKDLLKGDLVRCGEKMPNRDQLALQMINGRVGVRYHCFTDRQIDVWLSGCRKAA